MKSLLLAVTILAVALMTSAFAQTSKKSSQTTAYVCASCEMAAAKSGKCACGAQMQAAKGRVAYVCTHCNSSSHKAGNCKKCNMKLQKSFITYACDSCKTSSAQPGACKKCQGALHKHIVPMK